VPNFLRRERDSSPLNAVSKWASVPFDGRDAASIRADFAATDAKFLRVAVSSFLEMLALATRTADFAVKAASAS